MANENEIEELAEEEDEEELQDSDEEIDELDSDEEEKESTPEDIPDSSQNGPRSGRKWIILLSLICLLLLVTGPGIKIGKKYLPGLKQQDPVISLNESIKDNMREDDIAPFFIPLPPHSSKGVIRIDLSVIWDGLASVRYVKKELHIRNHLYRYMTSFVKKEQDLISKTSSLELEITRVFKELLDVNDLVIKIKEINSF